MMNLKNNFKIKLISIIFAFFMWIYVMAEVDPMVIRNFYNTPVKILNEEDISSEGLTLSADSQALANVVIRGRRSVVKNIIQNDIQVSGIIKNPQKGENNIKTTIQIPENLGFTLIPENVSVNLEEKMISKRKINISTIGKLKSGYFIKQIQMNPDITWVEGPESLVEKVKNIKININLKDRSKSFYVKSKIVPVDREGNEVKGVRLRDNHTYINVELGFRKKVPIKIVMAQGGNLDILVNSKMLSVKEVTLEGESIELKNIKEIETIPIDLSKISLQEAVNIPLKIPTNIKTDIKNVKLNLNITKNINKTITIPKERLEIRNNLQNLDISNNNLPENFELKVLYSDEFKEKFNEKDIQIFINMQEMTNEHSKMMIHSQAPQEVQILEIKPNFIELRK